MVANAGHWAPLTAAMEIRRLDPHRQVVVVMALVALLLLGLAMVGLIVLASRWANRHRRISRRREPPGLRGPSDWDPQPWLPDTASDEPPERRPPDDG